MKYSIATLVSVLAAGAAALPFPSAYTLVADGGWTVVTNGTHAFIGTGDINNYPILIRKPQLTPYKPHHPPQHPLTTPADTVKGGNNNGKITGTAQHRASGGVQHLYVMQSTDAPVTLTSPDSDAPTGAVVSGFGIDDQNYLTVNGKSSFGVDPNSGQIKEIYHLAGSGSQYQPISLWVKECKGC
ncbi:uncharacterized protein BO97DRAFT_418626 [Aspergillus homomorphus CBS 101889]|uniref:Uncharacterized protein n=1 Tax=Aspergillus homomorphus (strain CBS 101889) TaxID=1450537 RepID=A0A395HM37_ASPHC|nr:hypothetical protein BO97DRAFT_418626 [Aspergillus homomorphus CBS 101889]RAL07334.1 hypothetical protein BO97DRAFT_418626 [Aspergillus homomorphus CBS 101889]